MVNGFAGLRVNGLRVALAMARNVVLAMALLLIPILYSLIPIPAYAQQDAEAQSSQVTSQAVERTLALQKGLEQRMALDLRNMDIVDTLKFLGQKGNINIIAAKDVEGRVSLFLKDSSIKDALEIILLANNLAYEMRGDILYVMTEAEYKLLHGENFKDTRRVHIFKLDYAKPEAAFKMLETVKSDIGKLFVDEDSGSVILMDTPEKLKAMEAAMARLDKPSLTRVFPIQYARAADIAASLSARLDSKKTGMVQADVRSNQVIVSALPERMKEAEELIKSLDTKTKQVFLETKILKVILSDDFDMGVDWDKVFKQAQDYGIKFFGDFGLSSTITTFFEMAAGNEVQPGSSSYSAIVKILQQYGETRNLSTPSIAVTDGQEAKILVGTRQAYVTTTIETGGTTATTAAQVQFVDVGVSLKVTPIINDDGYITMKIIPEVSNVDSELEYQIAPDVVNTVPIVATTTAETTVMIKDGTTVVIGGLKKDEKIKSVDKLPFLGDIPWLGAAFRRTSDDLEKQEIVIFITPHIIGGDVDVADETKKPKGVRGYE